jgi:metal-responsive CopG/Arc/MetJ family transcriptional regulator
MAATRAKYTKDGLLRVVSFTVAPDQVEALDEWADEIRSNRSALMRQALDAYLRLNGRDPRMQPRESIPA